MLNSRINNTSAVKRIGTFLAIMFALAGSLTYILSLFRGESLSEIISNPSVTLSVVLAHLFYVSRFFNNKAVRVAHIFSVVVAGLFTIAGARLGNEIHGEFIIILSIMMAKIYGLLGKESRVYVTLSIIVCFVIKLLSNISYVTSHPWDFVYYMILVSFFAIFFLLILESEERKVSEEASIICEQWTKEQVYNDIGRTVFSTFMHDYHTDHAIVHLDVLHEMIDDGDVDEAKVLVDELKKMLSDDNENILRVKDKIRLSVKDKPEVVDSIKVLKDKVAYFTKAYKLSENMIEFFYHVDSKYDLFIVPIDFSGIVENLIKNAIEADTDERKIKILMYIDKDHCKISISNKGKMIPWRDKDGNVPINAFRVGRTTKKKGSGWGVYSIIKRVSANNGLIKVTSKDYETEFCLKFPVKKVNRDVVKQ